MAIEQNIPTDEVVTIGASDDTSWWDQANCLGINPDLFFPEKGDKAAARQAREVCGECVVSTECLEYAYLNNEKHGIWGGLSERQRRSERRVRALGAKAVQP